MTNTTLSQHLQPPARHMRWIWLSACLLIIGGTYFGACAYRLHTAVLQSAGLNAKVLAERASAVPPAPNHVEQEEQKRWAALKTEREFPWSVVFTAVGRAASPNIELLEFQPDKYNGRIMLRGEAKDLKSLVAYLDALNGQAAFAHVHLVHQEAVVRERLETVAFEIKAMLAK